MKKILIIGCGFAGASCCAKLAQYNRQRRNLEITVIDSRKTLDFLPLLPDIIGRNLAPDFLDYDTPDFLEKIGCNFVNDEVTALDLEKQEVAAAAQKFNYDYLVISSGSETNFYGNDTLRQCAYKLDSVTDAQRIKAVIGEGIFDVYLIGGAGYTGIEVATNLRLCLDKLCKDPRVVIVERAPSVLGPLPQWMKDFVLENLKRMHIEVMTNTSVDKIQDNNIRLVTGESFNRAMLIWAAGVKTSGFIQKLNNKKNPQGRLEVDAYLRLDERSFAVGDAALVKHKSGALRMAVQFSIAQGECAAGNIVRSIDKRPLRKYQTRDLGYIIPMANNRSCGRVMGVNLRGFPATILHYLMCIYRSFGFKNKWGVMSDLIKGGGR